MQLRQPLQTSCWMKTVSNSVLMMAPVGQTCMHEACVQCLQTSDIISQAWPLPTEVAESGTCSMNLTWRQCSSSSWPVLSKLSARKTLLSPWRPFHSLQATSQALQPMQMLVSVKKPYFSPGLIVSAMRLVPHQVRYQLGQAAVPGVEVERRHRQL